MNKRTSTARNIASGYLSLSTAKIVFMLSGLAIYFCLPRILAPSDFGNYGVAIGYLSVFNMMLVIGSIQTVSKFVSEVPDREPSVRIAAYRLQGMLGGGVSLLLFVCAPLAGRAFNDMLLVKPIRIGAFIPLFYAVYAVSLGSLNGRKKYSAQAALDMAFALIKTGMVIGGSFWIGQADGAVAGFLATSFLIMIIGTVCLHRSPSGRNPQLEKFPIARLMRFEMPVMVLTIGSNLLTTFDLFLVKALATGPDAAATAGFYTAAQTFSRIPYILVVALAMVMFPLISSSTFDNNLDRSRRTVKAAFRFPLVIIAPISIFLSACAEPCLRAVYPADYASAAPALNLLGFAVLLLALFHLGITMITGSGRPWVSVAAAATGIVFQAGSGTFLVPELGIRGAVVSAIIGWSCAFGVCGVFIIRRFKTLVSPWTIIRTVAAMALTRKLLQFLPINGLPGLLLGFVASVILYWSLLWIMREISRTELEHILSKIIRK